MVVLTVAYSGALISFFSINVYPSVPKTPDDMVQFVKENDARVSFCCANIAASLKKSNLESFKFLTAPERVSNCCCLLSH